MDFSKWDFLLFLIQQNDVFMSLWGNENYIGVFLSGDFCQVVKLGIEDKTPTIQEVASDNLTEENQASQVKELVNAVNPSADSLVVVGSDRLGNCVDLVMPKLALEDLHNALDFEIPKYTPLSEDEIVWGYRIVNDLGAKGLHLRLGITPVENWEHTINQVSTINGGVEIIVPTVMALDPAFGDSDYCTSDSTCYVKDEDGLRHPEFFDEDELCFTLPDEISYPQGSKRVNEQVYKAVLLACYGKEGNLRKDRRTLVRLPQTIQSKRRKGLLIVNLLLAVAILIMGIITGVSHMNAHNAEVALYNKHINRLKQEIESIKIEQTDEEAIRELETQMENTLRNRPSFADLLTVITETVDDSLWCDRLSWNGEKFTVGLKSQKDDSDIATIFEQTGVFENITFKKDTSSSNQVKMTLEMQVKELVREVEEETK